LRVAATAIHSIGCIGEEGFKSAVGLAEPAGKVTPHTLRATTDTDIR